MTCASDIMTTNIITITLQSSVYEIINLMLTKKIAAFPVVDELDKIIGIVTDSNMLQLLTTGEDLEECMVGTFMTRDVEMFSPEEDINILIDTFLKKGYRMLPIVKDGKTEGVVSRRDIISYIQKL